MISGHGQDPHGKKMSKSKGNFVVADDVIEKYREATLAAGITAENLGIRFLAPDLDCTDHSYRCQRPCFLKKDWIIILLEIY